MYILLGQIEAGHIPLEFNVGEAGSDLDLTVTLAPPNDYTRLYTPDPSTPLPMPAAASFGIRLLDESEDAFLRLTLFATVVDNTTGGVINPPVILLIDLDLEAEETDNGLEENHALRISLVGLDQGLANLLENEGIDSAMVEDAIREQLDRTISLSMSQGQRVQRIRMRKFVDGDHRSLGLYIDLALRSGPEDDTYHEPRGDVDLAQDFRTAGKPLAFATSPGLFPLLGPDLKFRVAEETEPNSGEFRFPLRKNPLDPESEKVGKIKDVSVGPEFVISENQPPQPTGRLMFNLHGEYTDAIGDPDFNLQIFFDPQIDGGIVEWDLDVDVDLGLLATLFLIAGGIILTLLFGPGLGWGSTLFIGSILGLAVLKGLIAEPLASKLIEDRLEDKGDMSFLDAIPFRIPASRRRWDPFYITEHQVVALVDNVEIDFFGIAFEGNDIVLDKQPKPVSHTIIRDEERSGDGAITALRYRVRDFERIAADLEATGPGLDRMSFSQIDPVGEPTLVSLTAAQIAERIEADRLRAPLTYTPNRIHLVENQIDALLCLSRRESNEERRRIINEFRTSAEEEIIDEDGDEIRDEVTAELEDELDEPPTDEEIDKAFDKRVETLVDTRQVEFEETDLPDLLEAAVAQLLRFDLAPEELIELQLAGVVILDGTEIIERHNSNGSVTPYYRDRPDGDPKDNLLALEHYTPPYQPPG
jgi:hypothetical protein